MRPFYLIILSLQEMRNQFISVRPFYMIILSLQEMRNQFIWGHVLGMPMVSIKNGHFQNAHVSMLLWGNIFRNTRLLYVTKCVYQRLLVEGNQQSFSFLL